LRLADNPRDVVAGARLLPLLPGIGPRKAHQLMDTLIEAGGDFSAWATWQLDHRCLSLTGAGGYPRGAAFPRGLIACLSVRAAG
jgi:hypothetical protein